MNQMKRDERKCLPTMPIRRVLSLLTVAVMLFTVLSVGGMWTALADAETVNIKTVATDCAYDVYCPSAGGNVHYSARQFGVTDGRDAHCIQPDVSLMPTEIGRQYTKQGGVTQTEYLVLRAAKECFGSKLSQEQYAAVHTVMAYVLDKNNSWSPIVTDAGAQTAAGDESSLAYLNSVKAVYNRYNSLAADSGIIQTDGTLDSADAVKIDGSTGFVEVGGKTKYRIGQYRIIAKNARGTVKVTLGEITPEGKVAVQKDGEGLYSLYISPEELERKQTLSVIWDVSCTGSIAYAYSGNDVIGNALQQMAIYSEPVSSKPAGVEKDINPTNTLTVHKISESGEPLEKAEFELIPFGKAEGVKATTDTTGTAVWTEVPEGSYSLIETEAPIGYIKGQAQYILIQNNEDGTAKKVEVTVVNSEIPRTEIPFRIRKLGEVEKDGVKTTAEISAEYELYKEDGSRISSVSANTDTGISLLAGDYYVVEKSVAFGYAISSEASHFTITAEDISGSNESYILELKNLWQRGVVSVNKYSTVGLTKIPVAGATFSVTTTADIVNEKGQLLIPSQTRVGSITTGENGRGSLAFLLPGAYVVTEELAPEGFVRSSGSVSVDLTVTENNKSFPVLSQQIEVGNVAQMAYIDIYKTAPVPARAVQDDTEHGPVTRIEYEYIPMGNVEFSIVAAEDILYPGTSKVCYSKDETVQSGLVTGMDGKIVSKALLPGKYLLKEDVPPMGMVPKEPTLVEVKYVGDSIRTYHIGVDVKNERMQGSAALIKNFDTVEGQTPTDEKAAFGLYNASDIFLSGPTTDIIEQGTLLGVAEISSNGRVNFSNDMYIGADYYIKEISTKQGYVLDETVYPLTAFARENTVFYAPSDTIINALQVGSLRITKTAEGPNLAGFAFRVIGQTTLGLPYDKTVATDSNGEVLLTDLLAGEYTVTEIDSSASAGYIIPEAKTVTVQHGVEAKVSFENRYQRGNIRIVKTSEGPLAGFVFHVVGTTVAGVPFSQSYTTGDTGVIDIPNVLVGSYTITEQESSGYMYVTPITRIVTANETTEFAFENKYSRGSLSISKTAEGGNKEGFCFLVEGTTDVGIPFKQEFWTNDDGKISVPNLLVGSYTVTEEPNAKTLGYDIPAPQTLYVTEGAETHFSFDNRYQRGELVIEKTAEGRSADARNLAGFAFLVTGQTVIGEEYNETFYTDASGRIELNGLLVGEYSVQEVESDVASGYIMPETQSVSVTHGQSESLYFDNVYERGDLTITKTAEGQNLEGFAFRVTGTTDAGIPYDNTVYSDASGKVYLPDLLIGLYSVQEIETDASLGYIIPQEQGILVNSQRVAEVFVNNLYQRGDIHITKTAEGQNLKGFAFHVVGMATIGTPFETTVYTDENGEITIPGLLVGTYIVEEVASDASAGYILPESQPLTVTNAQTAEVAFENKYQRASLKITKTSESGKSEGFAFRVTGQTVVGEAYNEIVYTNRAGEIELKNLLVGEYTVTEIEAPASAGYVLPDPQTVSLSQNGETYAVPFYNAYQRGNIRIVKTAEGQNLAGFTFRITGQTTVGVPYSEVFTTDENGLIEVPDVLVGRYTVTEIDSDAAAGYILPEQEEQMVLVGETTEYTFDNRYQRGDLVITKTAEGQNLSGFAFQVVGTTDAGVPYEETHYTDEAGCIRLTGLLVGRYTVTEVSSDASVGYVLPAAQEVTVSNGAESALSFDNRYQRGGLVVVKTAEGDSAEGFGFRVVGETVIGVPYDQTFYTNENGIFSVEDLLVGTYTITEIPTDASVGYVLAEPQTVNVTNNVTAAVDVHNVYQRGSIAVTKVAEGENLEGFAFLVTGKTDIGVLYEKTFYTDAEGKFKVEGLHSGTYTVTEVESGAAAGYILPDAQTVVLADKTAAELVFDNRYQRGNIEIVKTSEGQNLKGFAFHVVGETDAGVPYDEVLYTDENGHISIPGLLVGSYTVTEIPSDVSAGYVLVAPQTGSVTRNKTVEVSAYNAYQRGSLRITKTSEGENLEGFAFRVVGKTVVGVPYDRILFTDKTGVIEVPDLLVGEYTITEVEETYNDRNAADGYVLAEPQTVSVSVNERAEVAMNNVYQRGSLRIVKTAEGESLEGFAFRVVGETVVGVAYDEQFETDENGVIEIPSLLVGEYTVTEMESELTAGYILPGAQTKSVSHENQTVYEVNNVYARASVHIVKTSETDVVEGFSFRITGDALNGEKYDEVFVTDELGHIDIPNLLLGTYTVTEVRDNKSAPFVPTEAQTAEFAVDGETATLYFYNELLRGSTDLKKIDSVTGKGIEGVLFVIENKAGEVVANLVTDKDGIANTGNLPYGDYVITEVRAKTGYVLDNTPVPFSIIEHKQVIEFQFENTLIASKLSIHKTDESGAPLAGAEFTVIDSKTGETVKVLVTDANGYASADITFGEYILRETKAPAGYLPCADQTFQVSQNAVVISVDVKDQKDPHATTTATATAATTTATVATGSTPKAGVTSTVWFYVLLIGAAGCVAAVSAMLLKRSKKQS